MLLAIRTEDTMANQSIRFSPEKLTEILAARGVTPYGLAKKLGASQPWMQKLMAGKIRMPTEKYLIGMIEFLEVSINDLLELSTTGETSVPTDLYGDSWKERALRDMAPNTPASKAREALTEFNELSSEDRARAVGFMRGLNEAKRGRVRFPKIAEMKTAYSAEPKQDGDHTEAKEG